MGFLKPTAEPTGFLLPVFQMNGANGLSVQIIGPDGTVIGFHQIFPKDLQELPPGDTWSVAVGDPALWGYAHGPGAIDFDARETLQTRLRPQIAQATDPFIQVQMARFCEAEAELATAWKAAFAHLGAIAPRSAFAWRDLVILPAFVRQTVEEIAGDHGIKEELGYWENGVATQTHAGSLTICLVGPLFALFDQVSSARQELEKRTKAVREAFDIRSDRLRLAPLAIADTGAETAIVPQDMRIGRVVIGIGRMAEGLMRSIFPMTGKSREVEPRIPRISDQMIELMLIVRDDEPVYDSRVPSDFSYLDLGNPKELVIIFELNEEANDAWRAACELADRYGRQGVRVTAIIPHLPEPIFNPSLPEDETPKWLQAPWDAIWFLSDRSPSVAQQNSPFGPARSNAAATRHLQFALEHCVSWAGGNPQGTLPFTRAHCGIVGSAKGDRAAPTLLQHAITRLLHPEIDLRYADAALILVSADRPRRADLLKSYLRRSLPDVDVTIKVEDSRNRRQGEVTVALQNISLRQATAQSFAEMCRQELARNWTIVRKPSEDHDWEAERKGRRLYVDCKFDYDGRGGTYRSRVSRRWRDDVVLITTKSVRRKPFLRHVLNGQTTIHYSRASGIAAIHDRRFRHVITGIEQGDLLVERDLLPACLNWLATQQPVVDLLSMPARVEISDHGKLEHGHGPGTYMFRLPLRIKGQRASDNVMPVFAAAQVILDDRGWRLILLKPQ